MPKNHLPFLETREDTVNPHALIISEENKVTRTLKKILEEKNCQVILSEKFLPDLPRVSYIFQFADFPNTPKILSKAEKDKARLLLVEAGGGREKYSKVEKAYYSFENRIECVRIIRAGDLDLWQAESLADKLLWTLLSKRTKQKFFNYQREKINKLGSFADQNNLTNSQNISPANKKIIVERKGISLPKFKLPKIILGKSFWISLLLILIISPFIIFLINFYVIYDNFKKTKEAISEENFSAAENYLLIAEKNINSQKFIYNLFTRPFRLTGLEMFVLQTDRIEKSITLVNEIFIKTISLEKNFLAIKKGIFSGEDMSLEKRLIQAKGTVDELSVKVNELEDQVKNISYNFPEKETITGEISGVKEIIVLFQKLLPMVNSIVSTHGKKTYLVLFQNNMELRATGGFIGSYGLATFDRGKLTEFKIEDVYQADGQLKGHVEPPAPIAHYLEQPHWYLRDSNFDPDFLLSAGQAQWFLQKETGQSVDGVIGVNLSLIQDLVSVLDGLYLTDYQETVNADNLFLKAQVYSQRGFFPGSTQKRDFLGSLGRALIIRLESGDKLPWKKILGVLKKSLEEKNLQLSFNDQSVQFFLEELGWGGRTSEVTCQPDRDGCFADYLFIVESNLGVNKANYYVNRDIIINKNVAIDGMLTTILTLNYQNDSPSEVFPAGSYRDYLRVMVPKNAVLLKASINGRELVGYEVSTEDYGDDKKIFAFMIETGPREKSKVQVSYKLEGNLADNFATYQFFLQKQSGTKTNPVVLEYSYPSSWRVSAANFTPVYKKGSFYFTADSSVDRVFEIKLKK
ncbi:MAG: hypothetical protein UT63_C0006G0012 [Candidatus Gottesmanbacteria bacterium GW2011_GWC2_39_8]|uniref:DUF4012 domain-containing protein n=1 Tax=Candidatus Gottesmanbacteria bacterium GW2011_GWC2_39_8 TaxID=1618450 RepID=A0A0G0Q169_9BACT|nr:MAG: hypothetical protein UT63_C0006G0012 [Candidatus Gottesmanbacteria bacterium GW2011_GWC2_39_8]